MSIDSLIKEAELAAERQRRAWKDTRETQVKLAKAAIIKAMGENLKTFEPYISGEGVELSYPDRPDTCVSRVWQEVNAADEELAPFRIVCDRMGGVEGVHFIAGAGSYKMEQLADLLLDRRREFKRVQAETRERDIKNTRKLLDGYSCDKAMTLNEVEAAYKRLVELAPERVNDWRQLRKNWQEWRSQKDDEAAEQERLESLAAEYERFYRQYLLEHAQAVKANAARRAEMQKQLDVEYQVWELEYAVIASEDSERIVETRTAIALTGVTINDGGYWLVWENGEVTERFFYYLVSKKLRQVRPTMPGFGKAIQTPCGYLSVWPLFQERAISWKLVAVPLPQPPEPPSDLCGYAIEQAQCRARQGLLPDEELEFVPF
jgi:hypothetical protein